MPSNIVVPELGESIVEARVARWLKKVGEEIGAGEPVVELETDKIDLEVGSEQPGVLARIDHQEGDDVKVGEVLGIVDAAGSSVGPNFSSAEPAPVAPNFSSAERAPVAPNFSSAERAPVAPNFPPSREALRRDRDEAQRAESGSSAAPAESDSRATATARRMAEEHKIDLARVTGSGEGGRITKEDVQRFIAANGMTGAPGQPADGAREAKRGPEARPGSSAVPNVVIAPSTPPSETGRPAAPAAARPPAPAPAAPPPAPAPRRAPGERTEERKRMSKRRATIARRLVEAQRTAAMLTTFNEVDMSAVMALRARRKESFQKQHGVNLGLSSFFVKASVAALRAFPQVNAEIDGEDIVLKHYYDIGIAVGAAGGLVVPVLRDADRMSFPEIEHGVRDFAKRADDGTLTLEDLKGGTFTITNGGVFGSLMSTPILNPPQVGILGLHKIEDRPVAAGGQVTIKPMMYVALSYDHRIVDGREAVQFLVKIKELIEDPGGLLIEL